MIYFFSSSNKKDKLSHPVTIITSSKRKAYALAVMNFKKNKLIGTPEFI